MKLIIDIPSEMLEDAKADMLLDIELSHITKAIANGIPLEDIKAEIEALEDEIMTITRCKDGTYYDTLNGIELALNVIDKHIGETK